MENSVLSPDSHCRLPVALLKRYFGFRTGFRFIFIAADVLSLEAFIFIIIPFH